MEDGRRRTEDGGGGADKEIYLFGVAFASQNVGDWMVERRAYA